MKRVDPSDLRMRIYIQLRVLRGTTRTSLQRINSDQSCDTVARLIIERCLSGTVIYEPDRLPERPVNPSWGSWGDTAGQFGKNEAMPLPPPVRCDDGRCKLCSINDVDGLGLELAEAMWKIMAPERTFEEAGDWRATFLFMAHRMINMLSGQARTDAREDPDL